MDIVNANALYRPGPMEMIPVFVRRKFGEKIVYIHNDLTDALEETYGTIVFQEQIMLIAQKFAGYSLGMADVLRRAVSKKNVSVIEAERTKFVNGAVNQGYFETLGNEVYDYIAKFANYGFNKSHSVAYSIISYWMAYLKVNFYKFFMANLMTNSAGNNSLMQRYIIDCRKNNVNVLPPHINISSNRFLVRDLGIYYSLTGINNVGTVIVDKIMNEREAGVFQSFDDFVNRCGGFLTRRIVDNLIHSGTLSCFGITQKQMIETYDEVKDKIAFSSILKDKLVEHKVEYEEYSFDEISIMEKSALGFNLKYSLFIRYAQFKKQYKTVDLVSLIPGLTSVLFVIRKIKEIKTKKGDSMAFFEIYDDTANVDAVMFPKTYEMYQDKLIVGDVYVGRGKVEERNGKLQVAFENVYTVN
jgi:DNA polymerase-3 subunit alpha